MAPTGDRSHFDLFVFLEAGKCAQKSCPNVCLDCAGVVKLHARPSRKVAKKGAKIRDFFDLLGDTLPRWSKWPPRCAQRVLPGGAQGCPLGAQSELKGWRRVPKGAHLVLKACSNGGQGRLSGALGAQRVSKVCPRGKEHSTYANILVASGQHYG